MCGFINFMTTVAKPVKFYIPYLIASLNKGCIELANGWNKESKLGNV